MLLQTRKFTSQHYVPPAEHLVNDYFQIVKALADETITQHKLQFEHRVNNVLNSHQVHVDDILVDIRDGTNLIKFLEVLSSEKLPKPVQPTTRIRCIENLEKAFQFLRSKNVHLGNIGAQDIADGNPRMTLALIFIILRHFEDIAKSTPCAVQTNEEKTNDKEQQKFDNYEKFLEDCDDLQDQLFESFKNKNLSPDARQRFEQLLIRGQELIKVDHDVSENIELEIEDLKDTFEIVSNALASPDFDLENDVEVYFAKASLALEWMNQQESKVALVAVSKESQQKSLEELKTLGNSNDNFESRVVKDLSNLSTSLLAEDLYVQQISEKQAEIQTSFASLQELYQQIVDELDLAVIIQKFVDEVEDFEEFISNRSFVIYLFGLTTEDAWQQFKDYLTETRMVGEEIYGHIIKVADKLIEDHPDKVIFSELKSNAVSAWNSLFEEVRSSYNTFNYSKRYENFLTLHKSVYDSIIARQSQIINYLNDGDLSKSISENTELSKHLSVIEDQVKKIKQECSILKKSCTVDRNEKEISCKLSEILLAWSTTKALYSQKLLDDAHLATFQEHFKSLILWVNTLLKNHNKLPASSLTVSEVEELMAAHQDLKTAIDDIRFTSCVRLGEELLRRQHCASGGVREKLDILFEQTRKLMRCWKRRWEDLETILEHLQSKKCGNSMSDLDEISSEEEVVGRQKEDCRLLPDGKVAAAEAKSEKHDDSYDGGSFSGKMRWSWRLFLCWVPFLRKGSLRHDKL